MFNSGAMFKSISTVEMCRHHHHHKYHHNHHHHVQEELEPIFTSIYTVEMCTKILAMGFIMHPDSYLRLQRNRMQKKESKFTKKQTM